MTGIRRLLLALTAILSGGVHAAAAEPGGAPQLRIEIGAHSAPINAVAADAAGTMLATVSFDKTLRLWSAASGTLLRILRPPIGDGDEGAMYSVALTPDGRTAAAAGWTGSWDGEWSVYLFNTENGQMTGRVTGLPQRCVNVAISPDGERLAVAMKGGAGIRIYGLAERRMIAEDADYGDDAVWMDFAADGRLAVTSLDGEIRLYAPDGRRLHRKPGREGKSPYGVKFTPDGKSLAIGYLDRPRVEVLSGITLDHAFTPNLRGADNGFLQQVAWSSDGRFLFAGGTYERNGKTPIRRWDKAGKGRPKDLPVATKLIMHMTALPDGRMAYVAADPAMGILDAHGRQTFENRTPTGDFRGMVDAFRVSRDGGTVQFGFAPWGDRPARFSLARRELTLDPETEDSGLLPPLLELPGLTVEGWENGIREWSSRQQPKINGVPVALKPHETAMSAALARDGRSVVLGTSWRLLRLDPAGRRIWEVVPPGETLALNVVAGNRLVVAALGDGTIRWYRMEDGREVLALFALSHGRQWVVWKPDGDYMASADGDTMIGWHVNRGKDAVGAFHAVARLRKLRYRPDIVQGALSSQTADRSAVPATPVLPPHITVLSHNREAEVSDPDVTLRFRLEASNNATVRRIYVRANGRPLADIEDQMAVSPRGSETSVEIELPRSDTLIEIVAETTDGITSEPARIQFRWKGDRERAGRNLFILSVGISDYRHAALRLGLAAKDASDFQAVVRRRAGDRYDKVEMRQLRDGEADLEGLRTALAWIETAPGPNDVAMVFLAGHGVDDAAGRYYFVPQDADPHAMTATGLPYEDLRGALSRIRGRVFFFVDTCKSGAVWGRAGNEPSTDVSRVVNDLKSPEHGVVVFASSTGKQFSLEKADWQNGAFTKALVEGLDGKADLFGQGVVTVSSLDAYISNRVTRLTGGRQTPATGKPLDADFTLVSLR